MPRKPHSPRSISEHDQSNHLSYKPTKVSAKERKEIIRNAAHLLNKLRYQANTEGETWSGSDENDFWAFMKILPYDDYTSVIN